MAFIVSASYFILLDFSLSRPILTSCLSNMAFHIRHPLIHILILGGVGEYQRLGGEVVVEAQPKAVTLWRGHRQERGVGTDGRSCRSRRTRVVSATSLYLCERHICTTKTAP
jgi:hypothetical protein